MHKGHYGEYSGNAKWSKVTDSNMGATKRDDEAHMKYLKEDVDYDDKHGHSDSSMTSDEKHISKLAGDLKYDEKKHGSPAHLEGGKDKHGHLMNDTIKGPNPEGGTSDAERWQQHTENSEHHGGKPGNTIKRRKAGSPVTKAYKKPMTGPEERLRLKSLEITPMSEKEKIGIFENEDKKKTKKQYKKTN